jgi:hypothetical protein
MKPRSGPRWSGSPARTQIDAGHVIARAGNDDYTSDMLTLINPVERADPFDHADWVFEAKFDGFRAAADTVRGQLMSRSRRTGCSGSSRYLIRCRRATSSMASLSCSTTLSARSSMRRRADLGAPSTAPNRDHPDGRRRAARLAAIRPRVISARVSWPRASPATWDPVRACNDAPDSRDRTRRV